MWRVAVVLGVGLLLVGAGAYYGRLVAGEEAAADGGCAGHVGSAAAREDDFPCRTCDDCDGAGWRSCGWCGGDGIRNGGQCTFCNGRGKIKCLKCNGTGKLPDEL